MYPYKSFTILDILFLAVLWIITLITWSIEKRRTGYKFGPMSALLSMLSLTPTLFLMPGIIILKNEPGFSTYIFYVIGVFSCSSGYLLNFKNYHSRLRPLPINTYRMILWLAIFFTVISLAQVFYELVKFGFFSPDVTGEEAYAARALSGTEESGTMVFALTTLTSSFRMMSGFCIMILLTSPRIHFPENIRIVGWAVFVFWVFIQFASLSRGALIWPIMTFVALVFSFNRKVPWSKIIAAGILVTIVLILLTLFRHRSDDYYGRSYDHPGIEIHLSFWSPNLFTWLAETIVYYQGHSFGNFGIIADNSSDFKPSLGHESLRGSSFLFRFLAPKQFYYKMVENAQLNLASRKRYGFYKQWSTWFGSLKQSFGILGIPVVSFLTGFCLAGIQRFSKHEGGAIEQMYFAAMVLIAFTAPSVYFMGTVDGFGLFTFCFLVFVYIKWKRHILT